MSALVAHSFSVDGGVRHLLGPPAAANPRLLAADRRLEEPTSGEVAARRRRVTGPGRGRGMVFQSYTLFPG
jgi:NitT/TauT family transport system ATP-binding protein